MATNRFELLVTWYLRFNGYFTTPDFTIHPDSKKAGGGTDADVLAVRFRDSVEFQSRYNFERDSLLPRNASAEFLICEVKAGMCDINPKTWRDPAKKNVEYAVRWMGFEPEEGKLAVIAETLYAQGAWISPDKKVAVRFVAFGGSGNEKLKETLPCTQLIFHSQVIAFLRRRFTKGCVQIARQNWDLDVIAFSKLCEDGATTDDRLLAWASDKTTSAST